MNNELSEIKPKIEVRGEVLATCTVLSPDELKVLMLEYKKRHPEQFSGTPEWEIKVTAENAEQVFEETGILFKVY